MTDRPTIANLRSKEGNTPRDAPPKAPEAAEVAEEKAVEPSTEPKSSAEVYRDRLEQSEISLEYASNVFDAVMANGYYEETVHLGKRNKAVFRTRQYTDHARLQDQLERLNPKFAVITDDIVNRYNLAASLFEWNGKAIPHGDKDKDFTAAMELVLRLPGPVYALLVNELAKLDAKVMLIFSDGAVENF